MAVTNGLPAQTAKVAPIPTKPAESSGFFSMFSDVSNLITKTAQGLVPLAESYFSYDVMRRQNAQVSALGADGLYPVGWQGTDFSGGLQNSNNQTLLVIAGLAALGVAVVLLAK